MIRPCITKCEYCDKELPECEYTKDKRGRYPCCDSCTSGYGNHYRAPALAKRQSVTHVPSTKRANLEDETIRNYLEPEPTTREELEE